jgi:flagellar hook assembly protein FlgD
MNYPNPFSETTTFKFNNGYEGEPLEMSLNIYDLRGKIIYSIEKNYEVSPPVIDNLSWNGKDLNGYALSQGIYIYKLHVRNKSNNRTEIIHSKLLKLR